ncbi:hypothetical protein CARUB_v10010808mg [Capsella rubella]|uniref:Uncharacterized protein n=1 Tax=Capsella rubella TaxID=81985 RepID=R0IJV5_9BRAS|nr:hypothetical protein CARUB_v10010808mg [Capsella rubella]
MQRRVKKISCNLLDGKNDQQCKEVSCDLLDAKNDQQSKEVSKPDKGVKRLWKGMNFKTKREYNQRVLKEGVRKS